MLTPGRSLVTRKLPRSALRGGGSSLSSIAQLTIKYFNARLPVVYVLRPVMDQEPSDWRRAIVLGRPPRLGLPVAGSLAAVLIIAPCWTTSWHILAKNSLCSSRP